MDVVLVMIKADGERRSFPLSRDVTVIGRREDCDLRIPLTEVSRKHCRLIKDGDRLRLEDLGSSNGTYHNGARIQEVDVQPGDSLQVGPVTFTVQINGVPAVDEIQAPAPPPATDSSSGSQADVNGGGAANGAARTGTGMYGARPLTPEGDDFPVAAEQHDSKISDDIIDLFEPSPDNDHTK
jgi:predicted component of type VI protein secretion system